MIADLNRYLETLSWRVTALLALGFFALTFIISLGAVAAVIVRLPVDYFRDDYVSPSAERRTIVHWTRVLAKNAVGALLVLLGLFLSLPGVPGQGLLTILIGLMFLDFPGKRGIERRLISRPRILEGINALRARFGKAPLRLD